jgi:hypothetical protein
MSKRQLIEEIQKVNTSAASEFLEQFGEADLERYWRNLEAVKDRRVRVEPFPDGEQRLAS